jgi:hypothetical protein
LGHHDFLLTSDTFYWYQKPRTANEFGDSFGMANALFSALAFAFLIVTAIMQRKELELQRAELSETRKVLNLQYETLNFQRFEVTFFKLIDLHHKFVKDINASSGATFEVKPSYTKNEDGCIKGYPAEFVTIKGEGKEFLKQVHHYYLKLKTESVSNDYKDYFKIIQNYGYNGLELYYRNLNGIFDLINNAQLLNGEFDNSKAKERYFKILANQLSTFELIMLSNYSDDDIGFRTYLNNSALKDIVAKRVTSANKVNKR